MDARRDSATLYTLPQPVLPQYRPMKGRDAGDTPDGVAGDVQGDEASIALGLTQRIAAGDRTAEAELVERYSRPLLFMLRRRAADPALAEDLHQDVFRVVIERLRDRGIKEPTKLAGFIQSTGRNLLIGELRRAARRRTYADSDTVEIAVDPDADPDAQFAATDQAEVAEAVRRLLDELRPERDRALLIRFYLRQEDKANICAALGLTDLHFNRVLYRAKRRFRQLLESSNHPVATELAERHTGD